MDYSELIETRKIKLQELENLVNTGKQEQRMLNDDENTKFEAMKKELENLDKEIDEKRNLNNNNNKNIVIKTKTMENNFSLLKSIRNVVEGRTHDDLTIAVMNKGMEDFRKSGLSYRGQIVVPSEYRASDSVLAGTQYAGQEIVAEDKFALLPYLRANSVLVNAGAQLLGNLVGTVSIPYISSGTTASWATEVAEADHSKPTFAELTLSPKRLSTFIDISKQFLIQDSLQAEQMLRQDLMNALNEKLEATILGTAASSATQPGGIFNGVSYTFSGDTTWANVVSLETAVANNNALKNNAAYILHPSTVGDLKTTSKAGTEAIFILDGNTLNGYPVFATTNMPAGTIANYKLGAFGVWSDLIIGSWGGIDITVDMFSRATYGQIRVVINGYFDAVKRRSASFAYGSFY